MTLALSVVPSKIFGFDDSIRSALVVDRIGNVVSFASRTGKPVDPAYVRDIASKWVALFGGMLRGSEEAYGVLRWLHLRYNRLHLYCWPVDGGYLVLTARTQLDDSKLETIGTSPFARARYAHLWGPNVPPE